MSIVDINRLAKKFKKITALKAINLTMNESDIYDCIGHKRYKKARDHFVSDFSLFTLLSAF